MCLSARLANGRACNEAACQKRHNIASFATSSIRLLVEQLDAKRSESKTLTMPTSPPSQPFLGRIYTPLIPLIISSSLWWLAPYNILYHTASHYRASHQQWHTWLLINWLLCLEFLVSSILLVLPTLIKLNFNVSMFGFYYFIILVSIWYLFFLDFSFSLLILTGNVVSFLVYLAPL